MSAGSALDRIRSKLRSLYESRVADPDFQARASAWPITRWVARRQAGDLFDLCAGFVYSQILYACESLNLFETLAEGPVEVAQLAQSCGVPRDRFERLIAGAVGLRLLRRDGGAVALGSRGLTLLGNPGVRAMIRHHDKFYGDLTDLPALLRDPLRPTRLRDFWAYPKDADVSDQAAAGYSELMASSQRFIADQVLAAYDFSGVTRVLDVGGGQGAFIERLALRYPHLQLYLLDLPAVARRAQQHLASLGLGHRVTVVPGNFTSDALPGEMDMVTLVRVLHDHDLPVVQALLPRVRASLTTGGRVLVAEPMADRPGCGGSQAYFAAYFLAMGQGELRSVAALEGLLRQAGFAAPRHLHAPIPLLTELIEARRPD
jgi:demethylspheroidene O-methyltransferase